MVVVMGSSGGGNGVDVVPGAAGQPCTRVSVAPVGYVVSCCVFVCCGVVVDR